MDAVTTQEHYQQLIGYGFQQPQFPVRTGSVYVLWDHDRNDDRPLYVGRSDGRLGARLDSHARRWRWDDVQWLPVSSNPGVLKAAEAYWIIVLNPVKNVLRPAANFGPRGYAKANGLPWFDDPPEAIAERLAPALARCEAHRRSRGSEYES